MKTLKKCTILNCTTGIPRVKGTLPFCIKHGGGKRCLILGCPTSVPSTKNGLPFCIRHGGGRRCSILGCNNLAKSKNKVCAKHNKTRCIYPNCKSMIQRKTCRKHSKEYSIAKILIKIKDSFL